MLAALIETPWSPSSHLAVDKSGVSGKGCKPEKCVSCAGLKSPPPILKKTVGMMGMKGVPGLNIVSSLDKSGSSGNPGSNGNAGRGNQPSNGNKPRGQNRVGSNSQILLSF